MFERSDRSEEMSSRFGRNIDSPGDCATIMVDRRVFHLVPLQAGLGRSQQPGEQARFTLCGRLFAVVEDTRDCNDDRTGGSIEERLTGRELQIAVLVAQGHPTKRIADRLKISDWTVLTHLRRIFAKLGVDSRAAMVYRCASLIRQNSHQ